jgi:serine/threonine protein kinase
MDGKSKLGYNYIFGKEIGRGGFGRVVTVIRDGDPKKVEYAAKIFESDEYKLMDYNKYSRSRGDTSRSRGDTSRDETIHDISMEVGVLREISSLTMLTRIGVPNIINIVDVGTHPETGEMFMVMPRMKCDLHVALTESKDMDIRTKVKIAHGILVGIYHLHKNNIIHRDIKTENILLDNQFNPYIADFSLAKVFGTYENEKDHTHTGNVGTEVFRAPEVIRGEFYDKSVDIYGCGVIFMELFNVVINTRKDSVARRYIKNAVDKMPENNLTDLLKGMLSDNPKDRYTVNTSLRSTIFDKFNSVYELSGIDCHNVSKKMLNTSQSVRKYMKKKGNRSSTRVLKDDIHRIWVKLTFSNPVTKDVARFYYKKCDGIVDSMYCVLVASKLYESQLLSVSFIDSCIKNFDLDDYKKQEAIIMNEMDYELFV